MHVNWEKELSNLDNFQEWLKDLLQEIGGEDVVTGAVIVVYKDEEAQVVSLRTFDNNELLTLNSALRLSHLLYERDFHHREIEE